MQAEVGERANKDRRRVIRNKVSAVRVEVLPLHAPSLQGITDAAADAAAAADQRSGLVDGREVGREGSMARRVAQPGMMGHHRVIQEGEGQSVTRWTEVATRDQSHV